MSWLYEQFQIESPLNGTIYCRKQFGKWEVRVGGCYQSGKYMTSLWKTALKRIPKDVSIKKILMLGLGGGCSIPMLFKKYPKSQLTIIEWDEAMVDITDRIGSFRGRRPHIIVGDVLNVLPTFNETFDLIIVDLFKGVDVAKAVWHDEFFKLLQPLVDRWNGYLLVNAFAEPALFKIARRYFGKQKSWRFSLLNHVALFRPFGSGCVGDPLPFDYVPYQQEPGFIERVSSFRKSAQKVGKEGCWGLRWRCGPFWMERYTTNEEPETEQGGPFRMMIWQRLSRTDIPKGWSPSWVPIHTKMTGFSIREAGEQYYKTWTSHAQRHRKKWRSQLAEGKWELILEPSKEDFLAAYWKTKKDPTTKYVLAGLIKEEFQVHGGRTHLIAVRRKGVPHAPLEAGFCFLDIPENKESLHVTSFIHDSLKREPVGTGMVDYWFETAPARGMKFLNFGIYWAPGDPWTWKGFSKFKGQFGIHYLALPPALIRWTGSFFEDKNKRTVIEQGE